jgi:uncharacterized repeat protein (TIGR03803 family)
LAVNEGYEPNGLALASDGNFYGTAPYGGQYSRGTIFKMMPSGAATTIYSFGSIQKTNYPFPLDGAMPYLAALVQGTNGDLYGTTAEGGLSTQNYYGTVFRLSVPMPPVGTALTIQDNLMTFAWAAVAGQAYQVQYKTNLSQANWSNLGSALVATNGTITTFDQITSGPQRSYRLIVLP